MEWSTGLGMRCLRFDSLSVTDLDGFLVLVKWAFVDLGAFVVSCSPPCCSVV